MQISNPTRSVLRRTDHSIYCNDILSRDSSLAYGSWKRRESREVAPKVEEQEHRRERIPSRIKRNQAVDPRASRTEQESSLLGNVARD